MGDVLEVAEGMWRGESAPPTITSVSNDLTEVADDTALASEDGHPARARVNELRAASETSPMAKGIYNWAAKESRDAMKKGEEP